MNAPFDVERLSPMLRAAVERALSDVEGCGPAIALLEQHLSSDEGPDVRLALAFLLFEEARRLVLSQIAPAAERSLALIEEARRRGAAETDALARLHRRCVAELSAERRRERDLAVRVAFGRAAPFEVALLGRQRLERGGDALAAALLSRAGGRSE